MQSRTFPFCRGDTTWPCTTRDGARLRPWSALSITPAPIDWDWGWTDEIGSPRFAALPDTSTVSLSAPLAGGATATTSIEIPPVP